MHHLIGIDIGLTGALAAVDATGESPRMLDIPVIDDGDKRIDARKLLLAMRSLVPSGDTAAVIAENVRPRPGGNGNRHGNSMHSQGSLMRSRGTIEAVVACMGLSMTWVEPMTWKRSYGLIGSRKDKSRETAMQLYPDAQAELRRVKDHNRAEALLMARYLQGRTT